MQRQDERRENAERAKEYLSRVRALDAEIAVLLTQIRGIREGAQRVTVSVDRQPTGGVWQGSRVEDAAVRAADLSERVKARYAALVRVKKECAALIARVPLPEARALLDLRYVLLYPWERVTQELHYDLRSAYRLHNKSLRMAGILLLEEGWTSGHDKTGADA